MVRRGTRQSAVMALAVVSLFMTYARPCEMLSIRTFQVVFPSREGSGAAACLTFLFNAQELDQPGKTGLVDVSVPLDLPGQQFMLPLYRALLRGRSPQQPVWDFTYLQLRQVWNDACRGLDLLALHATLYGLRHGGASHDRSEGARPLAEVQQRGGWRTFSSVTRYEKHGRLGRQLQAIGDLRRRRLAQLTVNFEANFVGCFMPHFS